MEERDDMEEVIGLHGEDLVKAWEAVRMSHKNLEALLAEKEAENKELREKLEEAERLLRISSSANYENRTYYKDRDKFFSTLNKEGD